MKEPQLGQRLLSSDRLSRYLLLFCAQEETSRSSSLDEVDPEMLKTFERLGIPLDEQKRLTNVAVDVVFDSVSLGTTFQKTLKEAGVVLCSISEAVHLYPELMEKYLGSVVPIGDNFFAAFNSAVFSDGSFVYIPKGVSCSDGAFDLFSHQ